MWSFPGCTVGLTRIFFLISCGTSGKVFFQFFAIFYSNTTQSTQWTYLQVKLEIGRYLLKKITFTCGGRSLSLRCVSLYDGVPTLGHQNRSYCSWVPVHQTILSMYLHFSQLRKTFRRVIKSCLNRWDLSTSRKLPACRNALLNKEGPLDGGCEAHLCFPFGACEHDVRSQVCKSSPLPARPCCVLCS